MVAGCGGKKDNSATQAVAKVNKEEITVHQLNFQLQQLRGLKPEQVDAASKQILERLVDEELIVQKAQQSQVDRDPRLMQQIEAMKRDLTVRAYAQKVGEAAAKPTAEAIKTYYDDKPALFRQRRVYNIQELAIEASPEQVVVLRGQLQATKSFDEFADYLKANKYRVAFNQGVRPAEQLPLNLLDAFAKMNDGQAMLSATPSGAQVVVLVSSRLEPLSEEQARPSIEQFLVGEARRKLLEAELKSLRGASTIEYLGKFAESPASSVGGGKELPIAAATSPAASSTAGPLPAPVASGMSAEDISKGMGIKK